MPDNQRPYPVSDHFDGKRFFNPDAPYPHNFFSLLKWRFTRKNPPWPREIANKFMDHPPDTVSGNNLRVSWVGHMTFLLQIADMNILTDPVWSERVSPFSFLGPKRISAPGIKITDLPKIDIILITHNHYDHLDIKTLNQLWLKYRPKIITPLGNEKIIKNNIPDIEVLARDWFEAVQTGNIEIILDPAWHWSARSLWDRNKSLWASFIIRTPESNIYFAGDTGYNEGKYFRAALEKYKKFRLAILPIGAFKPRWFMSYSHISPEEAILAFQDLGKPYSIPSHYATFPLADDSYDEPISDFLKQAEQYNIDLNIFKPLNIGQYWFIPKN